MTLPFLVRQGSGMRSRRKGKIKIYDGCVGPSLMVCIKRKVTSQQKPVVYLYCGIW